MSDNDKKNLRSAIRRIKRKCVNCCIVRLSKKLAICLHCWRKTTYFNCCINRYTPSFVCIVIFFIPFCYILSGYNEALGLGLSILFSISLELTALVVSYTLFPRIVVTINQKSEFILWADGKKIYENKKDETKKFMTRQFSFQVWRKGEYELLLDPLNTEKPEIKTSSTYDHHVCHITFDNKEKNNEQN